VSDSPIRWTTPAVLGSVSWAGPVVAAGRKCQSDSVDNTQIRDRECCIEVVFTFGVAPTPFKPLEIYLIYSMDGTNFEDGSDSVDPTCQMAGSVPVRAVTSAQRVTIKGVPLRPFKFKVMLKNKTDQSVGTIVITVTSYSEQQVQV
jgi:hypothetical protein